MQESSRDSTVDTFAAQLRRLFDTVRKEDGTRYTKREVAEEITRRGQRLSKTHLYDLVNGDSEPGLAMVKALADFFGVPLDYFSHTERGQELNQQYELLAAFAEGNMRQLARGARQLSPESMRNVLAFVEFELHRSDSNTHTSE